MIMHWIKTQHFNAEFRGITVLHTRLQLVGETPYGQVKVKAKVAWDVPQHTFAVPPPEVKLLRNHCSSFLVKLPPVPHDKLLQTTLTYFDGHDWRLGEGFNCTILFCASKWVRSAGVVLNRNDTQQQNLNNLRVFMLRRMRNAYSPIC